MGSHLRKIFISGIIIAVIATIANLIVDNPYTHRLVSIGLNAKVRQHTNVSIDFQAIKVSVFPVGIDLYGVNVVSTLDPTLTLVNASQLRVRVSLFSLLMGRPKFSLVEARDMEFSWPLPADFPGFMKEEIATPKQDFALVWPPPFELPIERIRLRSSRIYLEHLLTERVPLQANYLITSLASVDLDLELDGWDDVGIDLHAQGVNVAESTRYFLEDGQLSLQMRLQDNSLQSSHVAIRSERSDIAGEVRGSFTTAPDSGKVQILKLVSGMGGTVDLSMLGSALDIGDTRGKTKVETHTRVVIPIHETVPLELKVTGEAQTSDGYIGGFRLYNSRSKFEIDKDKMIFKDADVIIGERKVAIGEGELGFDEQVNFHFRVKPYDLHLIELLDAFNAPFDLIDFKLKSPDLVIKGKGDPFHLSATGKVEISDINAPDIKFDKRSFASTAHCQLALNVIATDTHVQLKGMEGPCFNQNPAPPKNPEKPWVFVSPPDQVSPSKLNAYGPIFYENKQGIDLHIDATSLDLSLIQYILQVPATGIADIRTHVHGDYKRVKVDIKTNAQDVRIKDITFGTVTFDALIADEKIQWKNFVASPSPSALMTSPKGSLKFTPQWPFQAAVAAKNLSSSAVSEILHAFTDAPTVSFAIDLLNADISGDLLFPFSYKGDVNPVLTKVEFENQLFADRLVAELKSSEKGWSSKKVDFILGDLLLHGSFEHTRKNPYKWVSEEFLASRKTLGQDLWGMPGASRSDDLTLQFSTESVKGAPDPASSPAKSRDHLQRLPYIGSYLQQAQTKGMLAISGSLKGTLAELQGTFQGKIHHLAVLGSSLAPIEMRGFVMGEKLDLTANHSGSAFEGRLSFKLFTEGLPYEWYFRMNRLDLRSLGTPFFTEDPRNFAYLTANWQMRGKLLDWWHSEGSLEVKDIRVKYVREVLGQIKDAELRNEAPVNFTMSSQGWNIDDGKALRLIGPHLSVVLATQDNRPPEKLSVNLRMILDLALAKNFIEQVESATGKVLLNGSVTGSVENPNVSFEVTDLRKDSPVAARWEPLSLGIGDLRPPFRNIRTRILYKNGEITVEEFTADKGGGRVSVTGTFYAPAQANQESHIEISLKDAALVMPVSVFVFDAIVQGNLILSGTQRPYRLAGDLNIIKARSTKEFDLRDEILNAALRKRTFTADTQAIPPALEFDLAVTGKDSVSISNRTIQGVLSTNLQIKGTDAAPTPLGQVEITKGKFFYRRDFQINRGLITFDDPLKIDPHLDFLAMSEIDSHRVYVAVSGTASNPKVDLSIDPPTNREGLAITKVDIMVLISTGNLPESTRSGIGQSQSAAGSEMLNLVIGQFEEPVEKLFDLSGQSIVRQVYIDTVPTSTGAPVPRFNVPLNIFRDLDVMLRYDQVGNWGVSSEYPLHDSISLFGSVKGQEKDETATPQAPVSADTGVDLRFRFAFP